MLNKSRPWHSEAILFITAVILAAVSFFKVHSFDDPSGGDGYFYLKQTVWLADQLQYYHADYSLVFVPLALMYKITGSALLSYQILSSSTFFMLLLLLGTYLFHALGMFPKYTRILLSCLVLIGLSFQTPLLRLCFEFVKNGFAICLFLLAGIAAYRRFWRFALALGVLASLTHKTVALMFVLSILFIVPIFGRYRKSLLLIPVGLLTVVMVYVPRLQSHFLNFVSGLKIEKYYSLLMYNSHLVWSHVLLIFLWLAIALCHSKRFWIDTKTALHQRAFSATLLAFCVGPLFPVFSGDNYEIKWRLMIFSFCFSFILFTQSLSFFTKKAHVLIVLLFSLLLMLNEFWNVTGFPWVAGWSHQAPNVQELIQFVKPGEELITHHGLQFYVDYKTPTRAKSLLSPNELPKFQLAYIPEFFLLNPEAADTINQVKLLSIGSSYGLFYYEDFQELLKEFPIMRDQKNIFKVRPDFVESYPSK